MILSGTEIRMPCKKTFTPLLAGIAQRLGYGDKISSD